MYQNRELSRIIPKANEIIRHLMGMALLNILELLCYFALVDTDESCHSGRNSQSVIREAVMTQAPDERTYVEIPFIDQLNGMGSCPLYYTSNLMLTPNGIFSRIL